MVTVRFGKFTSGRSPCSGFSLKRLQFAMNRTSLFRDLIGFLVGGIVGAVAAGLAYVAVIGMPTQAHNGEDGAPLAALVVFMIFAGGFIGRRGFSAHFVSEVYPSLIGSYIGATFLCLVAGLSFSELGAMIGFATVGIFASATTSVMLMRSFPPKNDELA